MNWRSTLMLFALFAMTPAAFAVEEGDRAPAWRGTDLNGHEIAFPDAAAGRTSVLIFWATWCDYCRAFMPYLAAMQNDYHEDNVQILAINAKEDADEEQSEDPRAYMQRHAPGFVTILDGDAIADAWGVEYIPGLFVVDARGIIVYRRGWTELPAGQEVAEYWDRQVRGALNAALDGNP